MHRRVGGIELDALGPVVKGACDENLLGSVWPAEDEAHCQEEKACTPGVVGRRVKGGWVGLESYYCIEEKNG